jgi:hypothetical protein
LLLRARWPAQIGQTSLFIIGKRRSIIGKRRSIIGKRRSIIGKGWSLFALCLMEWECCRVQPAKLRHGLQGIVWRLRRACSYARALAIGAAAAPAPAPAPLPGIAIILTLDKLRAVRACLSRRQVAKRILGGL